MGGESLDKFFKLLSENQALKDKAESFGGNVDALAAIAREWGYDVSPEELWGYQDKAWGLLISRLQKNYISPQRGHNHSDL